MSSSVGCPLAEAAEHPVTCCAGCAGCGSGATRAARRGGRTRSRSTWRTSTDVCLISGGSADRAAERKSRACQCGCRRRPETVGAGGGSIVWRDGGGALRRGRRAAGAEPARVLRPSGERPTVTDANLVLGRLPERIAGGLELDRRAAGGRSPGLSPRRRSQSSTAEMLRGVRLVSVERGHDPPTSRSWVRRAGPLTRARCRRARDRTRAVPRPRGLSALGLAVGDQRRDRVDRSSPARGAGVASHGEADLQVRGQSFELTWPLGEDLAGAFHRAHEARYGYADRLVPSSSSPSGRQRCARPELRLPPASRWNAGPGANRARRRHVPGFPRGGGLGWNQ